MVALLLPGVGSVSSRVTEAESVRDEPGPLWTVTTIVSVAVLFAATVPREAVTVRPDGQGGFPWLDVTDPTVTIRGKLVGQHDVVSVQRARVRDADLVGQGAPSADRAGRRDNRDSQVGHSLDLDVGRELRRVPRGIRRGGRDHRPRRSGRERRAERRVPGRVGGD